MLATQSQVMALEENRVQLRLSVQALATDSNRRLLSEKLSAYLGRPFRVDFEVGALERGATLADAERREREAAHAALVERFKSDPLVQEVVKLFGGTVDEASVKPAESAEAAPAKKR